jgi:hypothetical protein
MNIEVHSHSCECSLQFCIAAMQDGSSQDNTRDSANTFPNIERSDSFSGCQEKKLSDFYGAKY